MKKADTFIFSFMFEVIFKVITLFHQRLTDWWSHDPWSVLLSEISSDTN